jgi:hypothetical protein
MFELTLNKEAMPFAADDDWFAEGRPNNAPPSLLEHG